MRLGGIKSTMGESLSLVIASKRYIKVETGFLGGVLKPSYKKCEGNETLEIISEERFSSANLLSDEGKEMFHSDWKNTFLGEPIDKTVHCHRCLMFEMLERYFGGSRLVLLIEYFRRRAPPLPPTPRLIACLQY